MLGYTLGLGYVSIAIVVMAVASCGVLLTIDKGSIDHGTARGGEQDERSTLRVLFETKPLLILAGTVFAYQTANGAMLPFLAQARTAAGADPSLTTGVMTVVSQATMVGAALLAARVAQGRGHAGVLSIALGLVVVRGILAAFATSWWLVIPVQVLEGLAMGLGGVAIPALVAEMMEGTGHATAGLGGVMTAYGAGATVSPLLAGARRAVPRLCSVVLRPGRRRRHRPGRVDGRPPRSWARTAPQGHTGGGVCRAGVTAGSGRHGCADWSDEAWARRPDGLLPGLRAAAGLALRRLRHGVARSCRASSASAA